MYSAGGGARISSAAVSRIIELATDGDGWTAEDVKQVEKRYHIKGGLGAIEEAVRWDYYVSPEEQQGLGKIMSPKNVARLAGGDGKNLSDARLQWFLGHLIFLNHLIFKPEKLGEDAKTHENYVYTICTLGTIDDRRAALEQLLKSGVADINPVARKMLDILNQGNSVQLEAAAFRSLMSSGVDSVRKNAVLAYVNLASKLEKESTSQEAIALRELVSTGDENTKAAAARAYAALAPKVDEKEAGLGCTALLDLITNGNEFTKWVAAYAYAALAPKIAQKEAAIGSVALRSLMSSDDKNTRLAAVRAYAGLAQKIEGAEVGLGATVLRSLISSGDDDTRTAAAEAYAALAPKIGEEEASFGATALRELIIKGDKDTKQVAVRAYGPTSGRIKWTLIKQEAEALRSLISAGNTDTRVEAANAYKFLAAKISAELNKQEAIALRGLMSSGDGETKAAAAQAYAALVSTLVPVESIGREATALRELILSGNEGTKRSAAEVYATLASKIEGAEVKLGAIALRGLMSSKEEGIKIAAVRAYAVLAPKIEEEEVVSGAAMLRSLMSSGNADTKKMASDAYKVFVPKIERALVGQEAEALRGLMSAKDEGTRAAAARAYAALAPKIRGAEANLGAIVLHGLFSSGNNDTRAAVMDAYDKLAPNIDGDDFIRQEAIALRSLMLKGNEDTREAAVLAYRKLIPKIDDTEAKFGASTLRRIMMMSSEDEGTKLVIVIAYGELAPKFDDAEVKLGASMLRQAMLSFKNGNLKSFAGMAYEALALKIEGALIGQEAEALRGLMSTGDEDTKDIAVTAYEALALKVEDTEVKQGAAALRALISSKDENTRKRAVFAYLKLAPKIGGPLLKQEITALLDLALSGGVENSLIAAILHRLISTGGDESTKTDATNAYNFVIARVLDKETSRAQKIKIMQLQVELYRAADTPAERQAVLAVFENVRGATDKDAFYAGLVASNDLSFVGDTEGLGEMMKYMATFAKQTTDKTDISKDPEAVVAYKDAIGKYAQASALKHKGFSNDDVAAALLRLVARAGMYDALTGRSLDVYRLLVGIEGLRDKPEIKDRVKDDAVETATKGGVTFDDRLNLYTTLTALLNNADMNFAQREVITAAIDGVMSDGSIKLDVVAKARAAVEALTAPPPHPPLTPADSTSVPPAEPVSAPPAEADKSGTFGSWFITGWKLSLAYVLAGGLSVSGDTLEEDSATTDISPFGMEFQLRKQLVGAYLQFLKTSNDPGVGESADIFQAGLSFEPEFNPVIWLGIAPNLKLGWAWLMGGSNENLLIDGEKASSSDFRHFVYAGGLKLKLGVIDGLKLFLGCEIQSPFVFADHWGGMRVDDYQGSGGPLNAKLPTLVGLAGVEIEFDALKGPASITP